MQPVSFASIGECMLELSARKDDLWHMGIAGDTFNAAWYARTLGLQVAQGLILTTSFYWAGGRAFTLSRSTARSGPSPTGAANRPRGSSPTMRAG